MKTHNLIDVNTAIMSAVRQNDWYGFQDLLSVEADYLEMANAIRQLLDFKTLSNKELRLFDSTYKEIIIDNKLAHEEDYVDAMIMLEVIRTYNDLDDTDETYTFDTYKEDYLDYNCDDAKEYYGKKYETILNQIYFDYFWLGDCLRKITDTKLEMLGQKEKMATV